MKRFGLIAMALGALLLTPAGAFARDHDEHHHHHHDRWDDRNCRDDRDDRDYREYLERLRQMEADRVANGYNPDGTMRYYHYYHCRH